MPSAAIGVTCGRIQVGKKEKIMGHWEVGSTTV